mmetsp:Transcript_8145/g.24079  ORF Transcript_8145/g.24079 Transcript_8145/m.24079 type:complete len:214 (-) Transcript_8145:239-880(-)
MQVFRFVVEVLVIQNLWICLVQVPVQNIQVFHFLRILDAVKDVVRVDAVRVRHAVLSLQANANAIALLFQFQFELLLFVLPLLFNNTPHELHFVRTLDNFVGRVKALCPGELRWFVSIVVYVVVPGRMVASGRDDNLCGFDAVLVPIHCLDFDFDLPDIKGTAAHSVLLWSVRSNSSGRHRFDYWFPVVSFSSDCVLLCFCNGTRKTGFQDSP